MYIVNVRGRMGTGKKNLTSNHFSLTLGSASSPIWILLQWQYKQPFQWTCCNWQKKKNINITIESQH
jgi:hypothetical protein